MLTKTNVPNVPNNKIVDNAMAIDLSDDSSNDNDALFHCDCINPMIVFRRFRFSSLDVNMVCD